MPYENVTSGVPRYLLRNSERASYMRCRWRWWQGWIEGWAPEVDANALRFGTLVHVALEKRYKVGRRRGPKPALTFRKLYDADWEDNPSAANSDIWEEHRELGIDMLEHYVERYGDDEHLEVIAPEHPFQVPLVNPKTGKLLVVAVGKWDLLLFDHNVGRLGLFDHKTTGSIDPGYLSLDEQAGTYWALAGPYLVEQGVLKHGQTIDFILYNFLRKALRDTRPRNAQGHYLNKPTKAALQARLTELGKPRAGTIDALTDELRKLGEDVDQLGEVSKTQPPAWFHREYVYRDEVDRENLLWRLRAEAWEMQQVIKGKLPLLKTPRHAGGWDDCRRCPFRDICEMHEAGADWESLRELTMRRWDPLADHLEEHDIPKGI